MSYRPNYEAPEQINPPDDDLTDEEREELDDILERYADDWYESDSLERAESDWYEANQ